jgi:CO/xanthine dehydrogenase FAD-binding subunit
LSAAIRDRPFSKIDRALVEHALASDLSPIDDIRSTAAYRRQVAVNLVMAALAEAWQAPERARPL